MDLHCELKNPRVPGAGDAPEIGVVDHIETFTTRLQPQPFTNDELAAESVVHPERSRSAKRNGEMPSTFLTPGMAAEGKEVQ